MKPRAEAANQPVDDHEVAELRKITISMPDWMLDDLRQRARKRGATITELIRRSVSLERILCEDDDSDIILRNRSTGNEVEIKIV